MKFKPKRAKVTTPSSLSDTIDVILRLTQVVDANVKEGRLATIAACLSGEDAQALQHILSRRCRHLSSRTRCRRTGARVGESRTW
jgi:hypothetical protein